MDKPPDHERMASDLEGITRDLERQRRDLEDRTPLWQEGDDAEEPDQAPREPGGGQSESGR